MIRSKKKKQAVVGQWNGVSVVVLYRTVPSVPFGPRVTAESPVMVGCTKGYYCVPPTFCCTQLSARDMNAENMLLLFDEGFSCIFFWFPIVLP